MPLNTPLCADTDARTGWTTRLAGTPTRKHVQRRTLTRVRLPITLHELRAGGGGDRLAVNGGRTLELCLTLAFFIGARPLEIFKSDQGLVHPVNCLTRGDVAFFDAHGQLFGGDISRATRFELLFRGHKGDQAQKGTVLVRTREAASGTHARLEADGGAVAALVELLCLLEAELPSSVPLAAFTVGVSYQVWSYRQATRALRQIAERAGMNGPASRAVHTGRRRMSSTVGPKRQLGPQRSERES